MARTTKQLSGGSKDKFLRALVAQAALPPDKSLELADVLCAEIRDVRVNRDTWELLRHRPSAIRSTSASAAPDTAQPIEPQAPAATVANFDPFVFSALAVLTKQGAAALAKRLSEIDSVEHLCALAKAQHLAVDAAITEPEALRAAMVEATQARLAERRAAAS